MYAEIKNGNVVSWPIHNLKAHAPNISFTDNPKDIPEEYVFVELEEVPEYDILSSRLEVATPTLVEDTWIASWNIVDLTDDEKQSIVDSKIVEVQNKRYKLLVESDWTVLPDAQTDKEAWTTYRQVLRDITLQSGYPLNVNWPEKPNK
jgi:hypothetical protein